MVGSRAQMVGGKYRALSYDVSSEECQWALEPVPDHNEKSVATHARTLACESV